MFRRGHDDAAAVRADRDRRPARRCSHGCASTTRLSASLSRVHRGSTRRQLCSRARRLRCCRPPSLRQTPPSRHRDAALVRPRPRFDPARRPRYARGAGHRRRGRSRATANSRPSRRGPPCGRPCRNRHRPCQQPCATDPRPSSGRAATDPGTPASRRRSLTLSPLADLADTSYQHASYPESACRPGGGLRRSRGGARLSIPPTTSLPIRSMPRPPISPMHPMATSAPGRSPIRAHRLIPTKPHDAGGSSGAILRMRPRARHCPIRKRIALPSVCLVRSHLAQQRNCHQNRAGTGSIRCRHRLRGRLARRGADIGGTTSGRTTPPQDVPTRSRRGRTPHGRGYVVGRGRRGRTSSTPGRVRGAVRCSACGPIGAAEPAAALSRHSGRPG